MVAYIRCSRMLGTKLQDRVTALLLCLQSLGRHEQWKEYLLWFGDEKINTSLKAKHGFLVDASLHENQ